MHNVRICMNTIIMSSKHLKKRYIPRSLCRRKSGSKKVSAGLQLQQCPKSEATKRVRWKKHYKVSGARQAVRFSIWRPLTSFHPGHFLFEDNATPLHRAHAMLLAWWHHVASGILAVSWLKGLSLQAWVATNALVQSWLERQKQSATSLQLHLVRTIQADPLKPLATYDLIGGPCWTVITHNSNIKWHCSVMQTSQSLRTLPESWHNCHG